VEKSFGIIPLRQDQGRWFVFLVQLRRGNHWGFPKGHSETNESPEACAKRELFEETHLEVHSFFSLPPFVERYAFFREGRKVAKEVVYFLAEVKGDPILQKEEIVAGKWVLLDEALSFVTYPESKRICDEVKKRL
jgi:8-oxo-dGTP pyrophosphatase MutT (NUDIX family)